MIMIDWEKLQAVYAFARDSGVTFTLNYMDASDEWYITVESVVAGENWIGKPKPFEAAITDATTWLRRMARSRLQ